MGIRMFWPLLGAITFLAGNAGAETQTASVCQNSCRLEQGSGGQWGVFCRCPKDSPGSKPKTPDRLLATLWARQSALPGQDAEITEQVATNSCSADVKRFPSPAAIPPSLHLQVAMGGKSLCDCVSSRVHFELQKSCHRTPANELHCSFSVAKSTPAALQAVRKPTLEDYQSCLAAKANHESGAEEAQGSGNSCALSDCKAPPLCGPGMEPFNAAETGACCPVYSCVRRRVVEIPKETGGAHDASAR
jgi:hypothetical protein